MLVLLSGYGGAGKDSVADILVDSYGFKRYAWADTLRLAAAALNPIVAVSEDADGLGFVRYNDAVEMVGYTEAKFRFPEVRLLLQRLGTEVGRDLIHTDVWVNTTLGRIERDCSLGDNIVITDTRFPNEASIVKSPSSARLLSPAYLVRVNRPGVGPAGDHPSETALDDYDFDHVVSNDGSLDDLVGSVEALYKSLETVDFDLQLF